MASEQQASVQQRSFWATFEHVAFTHVGVLKHVIKHLPERGADHLRGSSRIMRAAVNRTVTTVKCEGRTGRELVTSFPQADHLRLRGGRSVLDAVAAYSPILLQKIQTLHLEVHPRGAASGGCVASFLFKCTSLQCSEFQECMSLSCRFEGQGGTPAARRAHSVQRQLAMLSNRPDLLAPSSWSAGGALTSLTTSDASHLSAAMRTTSLNSLHVTRIDGNTLSVLQDISKLQSLTHLYIYQGGSRLPAAPAPASAPALMLALLATHTSLRSLHLDGSPPELLIPAEPTCADFPPSFAQLAALTCVHLRHTAVNLEQLTALQAVQQLDLERVNILDGGLTSLFLLTALTSLVLKPLSIPWQHDGSPSPDVDIPAAWQERLQELQWTCKDSCCVPSMLCVQLTSLVVLDLCGMVVVTPALCRSLCNLKHFTQLALSNPVASPNVMYPSIPPCFRPRLGTAAAPPKHKFCLFFGLLDEAMAALHVLALCTELAAPVDIFAVGGRSADSWLAVKGWSHNWLVFFFSTEWFSRTTVVLVDDRDVISYLAAQNAAGQWGPDDHDMDRRRVCLGEAVTPVGFSYLFGMLQQQPCRTPMVIEQMPDSCAEGMPRLRGWTANVRLSTEYCASASMLASECITSGAG